jgi:SAM-dependent methyltransferase
MRDLAKKVVGIYERHARAWDSDRNSNPWNDRHWHERFVASLPKGAAVLDLGCGSGRPVAAYLDQNGMRIVGVDASPPMIALCRERLPNHEWILGDMRALALRRKFQGILAWDSYFFLTPEDQEKMFEVFAAHAGERAVLMFNSGPMHGEALGEYRGEPLYHASLAADEYRELLAKSGFEVLEHVVEDARAGGRTVWLARRAHAGVP